MMTTPRKGAARQQSMTPSRGLPPTVRTTPMRARGTPSKKPANDKGDEGVVVAIRMRPLNTRESTERRTWRVLPQFNSVTQTTPTGQPLPERVMNRTFFTFDKTFGEDTTTRQVYDTVAKGIVDSVVSGLNGTIFAYGQTSSGKTFTMQGSGSIEEGSANGGGVVHMAAQDIFSYISNTTDRVFLVRASFVEIYNEEVRDLLGANSILQVREDPQRGVFVNSEEIIATDFSSLLEILFSGEKNRAVAATGMNERSSRSHTIFRITIESRLKSDENDPDAANMSEEDGAVRVSTLNLVDLAGSESVRHTGNTGDRLKEGAKINQSLLTLSRVIVGLGQPNQTHINFRDSKLTRILQPSLSGNARMAVVCCATPSELYLEETRSTLQFASRAKLVKTNAKVNEVIDDRSLIRRLQRELMEAKKNSGGINQSAQLRALETEAANAGKERREAEDKLKRLQTSILNSTSLFDSSRDEVMADSLATRSSTQRKRRLSDGALHLKTIYDTPAKHSRLPTPKSARVWKEAKPVERVELNPDAELQLVRHAVATKGAQTRVLQEEMTKKARVIEVAESNLQEVTEEKEGLVQALESSDMERQQLLATVDELKSQLEVDKERSLALLDAEQKAKESVELELTAWKQHSKEVMSGLEVEKVQLEDSVQAIELEKEEAVAEKDALVMQTSELKQRLDQAKNGEKGQSAENVRIAFELAQLVAEKEKILNERDEDKQKMQTLSGEIALLMGTMQDSADEKQQLKAEVDALTQKLEAEVAAKEEEIDENTALKESLVSTKEELGRTNDALKSTIEQKSELEEAKQSLEESTKELASSHETTVQERDEQIASQQEDISELSASLAEERAQVESSTLQVAELQASLATTESSVRELEEKLATTTSEKEAASEEAEELQCSIDEFEKCLEEVTARATLFEEEKEGLSARIEDLTRERDAANTATTNIQSELDSTTAARDSLAAEIQAAQSDLSEARTTIEGLESSVMVLRADSQLESSRFEEEKSELTNELEELKQELKKRSTLHSDSLSGLAQMEEERVSLQRKLSTLEEELLRMTSELEDKTEKVVDLSTTRNEQGGMLIQLEGEIKSLKQSLEEVNDASTATESELKEVIKEKDARILGLESDIEAKDEAIATSESHSEELQEKLAKSTNEAADLITAIEEKTSELDTAKTNSEAAAECMQSEMADLKATLSSKEETIVEFEEQVSSLQESVSAKESKEAEQTSALEQLSQEFDIMRGELTTSIERANAQVLTLNEKVSEQEKKITENESTISNLNDLLANAETNSVEQATALQKLVSERDATKADLEDAVESTAGEVAALRTIISEKATLISESKAEVSDLQEKMGQAVSEISSLTDTIEQLNNTNIGLQAEIEETTERMEAQISEATTNLSEKETVISEAQSTIAELRDQLTKAEIASSETVEERDSIKAELEQTMEQMATQISELSSTVTQNASVISESEATISMLQGQLAEVETRAKEKSLAFDESNDININLKETVEKLTSDISELRAVVEEKEEVISESNSSVLKLQERLVEAETATTEQSRGIEQLDETKADLEQTITQLKSEMSNLNSVIAENQIEISGSKAAIADLEERLTQTETMTSKAIEERAAANTGLEQEVVRLTSEINELNAAIDESQATASACRTEIADLQQSLGQAEGLYADQAQEIEVMNATKLSLEETIEGMTTEISELKVLVTEKEKEVSASGSMITDLQKRLADAETALFEKSAAVVEDHQQQEAMQADLAAALVAKQQLEQDLASSKESLDSLMGEQESLNQKLLVAEQKAQGSDASISEEKRELSNTVTSLEAEKWELSQLLTSANESVKEARQAALVADDELDLKEQKLEATLNQLAVLEQEMTTRTSQIHQLEERLNIAQQANNNDDLLQQIEKISLERVQLERILAEERAERKNWEEGHKKRMGEEQRALIQQAENEMSSLRTERDQLKSALRHSETDVYTVKQENDELADENKRLESKMLESQRLSSATEQELSQMKSINFDLNIEKKDLTSKLKAFRKERGVQDNKSTEEVVKVTAELNRMKAENYEVRQQCLDMEETVRNLERQCEKTISESQSDRKRRLELESILPELEAEIQKLRAKAHDASGKAEAIVSKENAENADTMKKLQGDLKDAKKEIKSKEARIKKLQSVSLSKEQCAALKKIKEERVQFKEENETYRKKLADAERDVTALRTQVSNSGSSSRMDKQGGQDIATLRFEKEALETKLRKYLSYCKALESDKNHIIDSLRARKRAVVDDDFAGAVVSLCDQLTSLEEECDALSNAEGRASSYLVDMERLRERISTLQKETDESQNKLVKLTRSEAELSSKLKRAEEKNGSLRDERDKLRNRSGVNNREAEPEKSRQVKYLEQENLQLMLDLKTAKKQLQTTRSELDVLRMKALDDDTEDFTTFMNSQSRASDVSSSTQSKTSRGSQSASPTEDKENKARAGENSAKGSAPESEKKRRFSRAKPKSTRMRESNSRAVGLGETGADENNTEECRQS